MLCQQVPDLGVLLCSLFIASPQRIVLWLAMGTKRGPKVLELMVDTQPTGYLLGQRPGTLLLGASHWHPGLKTHHSFGCQ